MNLLLLVAILAFAGSIWLSNKDYATDTEKQAGHRIAMIMFFLVVPACLYFGGGSSDLCWDGNRSGAPSYCP